MNWIWWGVRRQVEAWQLAIAVRLVRERDITPPPLGPDAKVLTNGDWYGARDRIALERVGDDIGMWDLSVANWPASRADAVGLRTRRAQQTSALMMDGEMRTVTLAFVEEFLGWLVTRPAHLQGETEDFLVDLNEIITARRPSDRPLRVPYVPGGEFALPARTA